jgi:hypothetical protein
MGLEPAFQSVTKSLGGCDQIDFSAARVKDVLLGFRERNKNKIREALKSISDQIAD